MRRSVVPSPGRSSPPFMRALPSRARTTVVPAATTRRPARWVSAMARTVAAGTSKRSGRGSAASMAGSPVEERPAACVREARRTPRARSSPRRAHVSGRPALGISTAQGRDANGVCTCQRSSARSTCAYCTGRPWRYSAAQRAAPFSARCESHRTGSRRSPRRCESHRTGPRRSPRKRTTSSRGRIGSSSSTTTSSSGAMRSRSPRPTGGGAARCSVRVCQSPAPRSTARQRSRRASTGCCPDPPFGDFVPSGSSPRCAARRTSTGSPRAVTADSEAGTVAASFTTRRSPADR